MAVNWNKIEQILGSRTGQAAMTLGGGLLTGMAASGDNAAARAQNAQQFAANARMDLAESDRSDARSRAVSAAQLSPLGENEEFASRQALARALLPTLRNAKMTPGDPAVAAAMGTSTGGFRLPEGGLPPEAMAHFSEQATANAIARRAGMVANVDPNAPGVDFAGMGFGNDVATAAQGSADAYQNERLTAQQQERTRTQELLEAALNKDYTAQAAQKKNSGGFWRTLGKVASFAAPIVAAPFTGGTSLALIGAGAGAANAALSGKGLGGIALGAGMGALGTKGLAGKPGALASKPLQPFSPYAATPIRRGR